MQLGFIMKRYAHVTKSLNKKILQLIGHFKNVKPAGSRYCLVPLYCVHSKRYFFVGHESKDLNVHVRAAPSHVSSRLLQITLENSIRGRTQKVVSSSFSLHLKKDALAVHFPNSLFFKARDFK